MSCRVTPQRKYVNPVSTHQDVLLTFASRHFEWLTKISRVNHSHSWQLHLTWIWVVDTCLVSVNWRKAPLCVCFAGMDFHEDLSRLGEKEGLKGRKQCKAVESFTWNITVLKVLIKISELSEWMGLITFLFYSSLCFMVTVTYLIFHLHFYSPVQVQVEHNKEAQTHSTVQLRLTAVCRSKFKMEINRFHC